MAEKKVKSKIRKSRVSDEQLIEALEKSGGIMAAAARAVGLDRSTVHHRVNASPKLKAVWENVREINLDAVESKLNQAIQAGELAAIFFYLKCQGKRRGWVERQEFDANLNVRPLPPIEDDGWLG
jgi:hypothetical protein